VVVEQLMAVFIARERCGLTSRIKPRQPALESENAVQQQVLPNPNNTKQVAYSGNDISWSGSTLVMR
jgi:hypothetical protein